MLIRNNYAVLSAVSSKNSQNPRFCTVGKNELEISARTFGLPPAEPDFDQQRDPGITFMDPKHLEENQEYDPQKIAKPILEISTPDSEELSLVYGKKGLFNFLSFFDEISEKDKHKINYQFALRDPIDELLASKPKGEIPKICGKNGLFRKYEHVCSNNMIKVASSQYSDDSIRSENNWF